MDRIFVLEISTISFRSHKEVLKAEQMLKEGECMTKFELII